MTDYADESKAGTPNEKLIEKARRCFKQAREAGAKQLDREVEDLKFQVPEHQWEEGVRAQRQGGGVTPPRPTLSISKIDQPMQLVSNQMRSADLGVNIHPVSEDADDDTAEMLQGLYRHIERTSRAELARSWAFDRARAVGRGFYRVMCEYDEEGGHPLDQKITIKRILHQEGVYLDPEAQEPDYSDGKWAMVCSWMGRRDFDREYPGLSGEGTLDWDGISTEAPDWVDGDDVLKVEYWYKEFDTKTFCLLDDGSVIEKQKGESYDPPRGRTIESEHEIETVTVFVCKLYGGGILEEPVEWDGKYIPIIPVIGRELIPFDSERIYFGMIRPARDGQQLYNYAASTLVEDLALEPKTPYIGAAGQFEGFKEQWAQANTRHMPYLEYNPVALGGALAPPPQRMQIDTSKMQLAMMTLQEADRFIQATTAVYDQSLGRQKRDESGKAIRALQEQSDASTSGYMQNLGDISMTYEAKVILDLIPRKYDRPGRVTRILRGDDDKTESVMLNRPFIKDRKTRRPVAAAPGAQNAKNYNLRAGTYAVSVSVGKSFQTRLQEGSERIGEMLTAKPELFMLMGDLFLRFQDWPGAKEMSERMAKVREKQFPGLGEGEDGQAPPEQLQAQNQALQQQLQMLQQQLQMAAQEIQTEQAKQQATMAKAEADNAARMEIARMNNETKIAIEEMRSHVDRMAMALEHANETRGRHEEMAHEVAMGAAGGRSFEMRREGGEETDEERGHETTESPAQERAE